MRKPLAKQYSERTKNNKQLMKAFENLATWLKVKEIGRTKIDGYIIQGFLKKSGSKINYVFGKQFYKRFFTLNFDTALMII